MRSHNDSENIRPTHFICSECKYEFLMAVTKRKFHNCEKCGQLYELVPTRYGVVMALAEKNIRKIF